MSLNEKVIKQIKNYQATKDLTIGSGRCKHYPSCSNYALECYQKFGFIKASFLSGFRILRCNPLTKKVYDPVPLTRLEKKELKEKYEKLNHIVPYLCNCYEKFPHALASDYIRFIYDYTFDKDFDENKKKLFYDYLYIFKVNVKKKNIPLNYKEVYSTVNNYLMSDFHKPTYSDILLKYSNLSND